MKILKLTGCLLVSCIALGIAFSQNAVIKGVYVKNGEIFTIGPNGHQRQLTDDGIPKSLPLWSKDGTKIAFLRKIDHGVALGNLLVIDAETGQILSNVMVRPVHPNIFDSIRYIDHMEWLTTDKVSIVGNINPSTADTIVLDAKTGKELADYTDDAGGAVLSPDGEHIAAETGRPHWTPEDEAEPELDIDYKRIYPAKGVHVIFLTKPAWSEDGKKIAIAVEYYQSSRRMVVSCSLDGVCESVALPDSMLITNDDIKIQWGGGVVYVSTLDGAWSWQGGNTQLAKSVPPQDRKSLADNVTSGLQAHIKAIGGKEPDFWCADCILAKLPRRTPN